MVAIYLAPVYLLVCVYILLRGLHWIQVLHAVFQNVWGVQRDRTYLSVCCLQYSDRVYGTGFGISEIYEASE